MKFIGYKNQIINLEQIEKIENDPTIIRIYFKNNEPWYLHFKEEKIEHFFYEIYDFLLDINRSRQDLDKNEIFLDLNILSQNFDAEEFFLNKLKEVDNE